MSLTTALYNLIIGPLELLFQVIFALTHRVIGDPGLTIIVLSLVVNFLVLPLYNQADAMQAREREQELKMKHWVDHIKKNFKGDERFMMLQTYYRQNNYKPTDALKGSVSLLLEIPFFIAAYNFLSGLHLLEGVSFGPITDLSRPDELLVLGSVSLHLLPILMTAINLVSGMIYTKGLSAKSKIQLYVMALLFLVLLYDSPSGLVFYWTLNNLFSLAKNIFVKMKNPKRAVSILASVAGFLLLSVVLFVHPMESPRKQALVVGILLLLQLPLLGMLLKKKEPIPASPKPAAKDRTMFVAGCIFLTLFTGAFIPSGVIAASPDEFVNQVTRLNPLVYVLSSLLLSAGIFLVWFNIFYALAKPGGKNLMGLSVWLMSGAAVIDFMFFGTDYGLLSSQLKYDSYPAFATSQQFLNLLVLTLVLGLQGLIWKKKKEIARVVCMAAAVAVLGMTVLNCGGIQSAAAATLENLEEETKKDEISIPLSREGKNVMVIMMDRAIGGYIPYILNERPELQDQFSGFTYYPNTISFGGSTNIGLPALYGGYEYTPKEMNRRDQELLVDKHNEALSVMPVMFSQENFRVTVCDPTYAGYKEIPDLSIYDSYPEIKSYITMGKFDRDAERKGQAMDESRNRNLFCYSIFKSAPVVLQPSLYSGGLYNDADALNVSDEEMPTSQVMDGLSIARGSNPYFMRAYTTLEHFDDMTEILDGNENTFMMICNDTTHEPTLLQEPQYEPDTHVDNTEYDAAHTDRFLVDGKQLRMDTENRVTHYQINMAAMIQLGKYMDFLRENGVYDNTRIIIVADHGKYLEQRPDMTGTGFDIMQYNPLLLVKDFDSEEFTTDNTFMTNSDVPTLASSGIIENPTNPFTGRPINSEPKKAEKQYILHLGDWDVRENNGTTYNTDKWATVHDDIFDDSCWEYSE